MNSYAFNHIAKFYEEQVERALADFNDASRFMFLCDNYEALSSIDKTLEEITILATPIHRTTPRRLNYAVNLETRARG